MQIQFKQKINEGSDIYSFVFEPLETFAQTTGQFIEINLKHQNPDNRGSKRWFTLSSSPKEEFVQITTRIPRDGPSSFKQALVSLAPDTVLSISHPEGDFTLPTDSTIPLLFVAGGIGITPFRSMITELAAANQSRNIHLVYAGRSTNDLVFRNLFEQYGAKVHDYIDTKITLKEIVKSLKPAPNTIIYMSGPEPMIESFVRQAKTMDLDKKLLKTDYFPGYKENLS